MSIKAFLITLQDQMHFYDFIHMHIHVLDDYTQRVAEWGKWLYIVQN